MKAEEPGALRPDDADLPLLDLPLRTGAADLFAPPSSPSFPAAEDEAAAAPLSRRWRALAADAATVVLLVAAATLAATALRARPLAPWALAWAAGFALYLSFFAAVVPLVLFGRTLGMALADLTARAPGSPRIRSVEGTRRWLGTLATFATLGIPLLFTKRDSSAPSLADRFSGRPLLESDGADRS